LSLRLLVLLALALALFQLLPLGALRGGAAAPGLPLPLALTADWNRTFESLLFALPLAVVFLVLGKFSENDFNRLLPFFLLAVMCNVAFALVQFTASSGIAAGFLPYQATGGFFANSNHFGALLFVAIPFVVYPFVVARRLWLSLIAVGLLVFVGFATRSVAGAFLSAGCALVSYALIGRLPTIVRAGLFALAVVSAGVLSLNPGNVLEARADNPLDRPSIYATTIEGITRTLPLGTGFGTFDLVYPQFEDQTDVRREFVNHAHNDYLEVVLEGGLPAAVLILAYFVLLALAIGRLPRTPLRMAAVAGLGFLLIHSLVDYPLRTTGMALVFVVLNAIIFSRALEADHRPHRTRHAARPVIARRTPIAG
jgi:hypothetical protein